MDIERNLAPQPRSPKGTHTMKLLGAFVFASAVLCGSIATAAPAKAPAAAKSPPPAPAPPPTPPPAPAAKPASPPSPAAPAPALTPSAEVPEDDYGHAHQFNFRTEFLTGYRMQLRYDKSPRCAPYNYEKPNRADQQKFCGYGAAPGLGIALGFALIDSFEPFAFMHFGLSDEASQTNAGKLLQVGAGARLYTMSDSRFKIFFSPWLGVDLTPGPVQEQAAGQVRGDPGFDDAQAQIPKEAFRTDLLVHLDIGPQYDFSKGFGVYLSGGLTFQMLRYLGASADLAIGVQLRAP